MLLWTTPNIESDKKKLAVGVVFHDSQYHGLQLPNAGLLDVYTQEEHSLAVKQTMSLTVSLKGYQNSDCTFLII